MKDVTSCDSVTSQDTAKIRLPNLDFAGLKAWCLIILSLQ